MNPATDTTHAAPATSPATAPAVPRLDLYRAAHKGLRFMLTNLLVQMGQADLDVEAERTAVLDRLEATLAL